MKRTRIITLLVVLALALTVVAPAFAYEPAARIPWRELAEYLSWLLGPGTGVWGFFVCYNEAETYWGLLLSTPPEFWRELPDWLWDEYIDFFEDSTGLTFGPCRNGKGNQGGI